MKNIFKISGRLLFDPKGFTSKQVRQGEWKKVAMVMLEEELELGEKGMTEYYAWFIKKRFNLPLQKPLRGAHVTIVNDRASDIKNNNWEEVKKKWNGKKIDIYLHVDPFLGVKNRKGNYCDWWLVVPYEYRDEIHSIRKELGLRGRSYFGLHMTIGTALNFYPKFKEDYEYPKQYGTKGMGMYEEHSEYILKLAQNNKLNLSKIPIHKRYENGSNIK